MLFQSKTQKPRANARSRHNPSLSALLPAPEHFTHVHRRLLQHLVAHVGAPISGTVLIIDHTLLLRLFYGIISQPCRSLQLLYRNAFCFQLAGDACILSIVRTVPSIDPKY